MRIKLRMRICMRTRTGLKMKIRTRIERGMRTKQVRKKDKEKYEDEVDNKD